MLVLVARTFIDLICKRSAQIAPSGLPCPVNDVLIMNDGVEVKPGQVGEIWM